MFIDLEPDKFRTPLGVQCDGVLNLIRKRLGCVLFLVFCSPNIALLKECLILYRFMSCKHFTPPEWGAEDTNTKLKSDF